MTLPILFSVIKIVIVLAFLVTTAGVLTWAERRQSAMIQDRVGPNRAVVHVPGMLVKGLVLACGFAFAVLFLYDGYGVERRASMQLDERSMYAELAILVTWLGLAILQRSAVREGTPRLMVRLRDARVLFYAGLALHLLLLLGWLGVHPESFDKSARIDPDSALLAAVSAVSWVGPAWLATALALLSLWTARRIPNGKVGVRLAGLLHLVADGVKMAYKEDFIPPRADRLLHALAPIIALFPALVTFAVVPFGDTLCVSSGAKDGGLFRQLATLGVAQFVPMNGVCAEGGVPLQIANLNVGILYMFALAGTGIVGAAIAGWSSDNKFSLLGGLRASSQMVGYEVAMGMTLVGAFMVYGTVRLDDMVRWQADHAWGIFVQPLGFVLFLAASIAEQKRTPFDAPEGESEIVAGYFVEYSGMKWAMFYLGEYIEIVVSSAVLTTIFFGGWALPFVHRNGITVAFGDLVLWHWPLTHWGVVLIGMIAFFGKVLLTCWAQIFIRWTVPRFRYDQIMNIGWRILLPGALINIVGTGVLILAFDRGGPGFGSVLDIIGDVSQAVLVVVAAASVVALALSWLAPPPKRAAAVSSSADRARAGGGTTMTPMQA
jgi:NADH-quinone oxidoreductase subunit H